MIHDKWVASFLNLSWCSSPVSKEHLNLVLRGLMLHGWHCCGKLPVFRCRQGQDESGRGHTVYHRPLSKRPDHRLIFHPGILQLTEKKERKKTESMRVATNLRPTCAPLSLGTDKVENHSWDRRSYITLVMQLKKEQTWDFPGGPVVKTLPSTAGGLGSINPWSGR